MVLKKLNYFIEVKIRFIYVSGREGFKLFFKNVKELTEAT